MENQRPIPSVSLQQDERRRSERRRLGLALKVGWTTPEGTRVEENAETEEVSAHGALLRLRTRYPIVTELKLENPRTGQSVRATAVWKQAEAGGTLEVAVAFATPSETFWL